MLRWRIISAIVIIAIFASACFLDISYPLFGVGGLWLMPLGLVVTVLATFEVRHLVFKQITGLHLGMLTLGNLLIFASAAIPVFVPELRNDSAVGRLGLPMLVFALATCFAFAEQMRTYRSENRTLSRLGRSVLAMAYAGLLMSFFVSLRMLPHNPLGFVALSSLIIVVKMSDIGAYTVGRICGGRFFGHARLAPILSPKKTIEGCAGGVAFGCLGSYLSLVWIGPLIVGESFVVPRWWAWLGYGVVLTITGMFGDLAESLLKREAGAKDSSHWLPGLGGILDLLDSILFAAPVAYAIWSMGILGS